MPQVIFAEGAVTGMKRCRKFLSEISQEAARNAGQAITQQLLLLESNPGIGRPVDEASGLRELVIDFGNSGYVALYRHDHVSDLVEILAFRHQREAGCD